MRRYLINRGIVVGLLLMLGLVLAQSHAAEIGYPSFLSPQSTPIAIHDGRLFVANTPADTLDVLDAASRTVIKRIGVGIDPVSVAVRPDGKEVWVSNHVSDSVSVVDSDPASPTYLQVIATVQDFDPATQATRFDEPVGIAFASNAKAYVALSSENQIAVINVATRQIDKRLNITAQEPRALVVRGGRLFVIPFESGNQTQLSGCVGALTGELCTFDAIQHSVTNNNVLSRFATVDIVKNPRVPDRDLYVFNTSNDQPLEVVNSLGTLLYGIAVDSVGRVFVAQADARNHVNGRAGTRGDGVKEMDNRAFLNQITRVDCRNRPCTAPQFIQLEPLPPIQPTSGTALATPFAIQISADDATLVVTAAGSNKLFTVNAATGDVLGRVDVDAIPRGIALEFGSAGEPKQAWVLNAGANSVSLVNLSSLANPELVANIALDDPTHPQVKQGRLAFNNANASTSGTFSCESCHPDGGTDQLLWVLDTPPCNLPGCTQRPPRLTMPIRGLRDTAPFHWDGIPGDPYGGINTANLQGADAPNCAIDQPESCTRVLVDGSLGSTMCDVTACPINDEGKRGALSAVQRDAMAKFLLSVPYPPAQRRAYGNRLSTRAQEGFRLFHVDGDLQGGPEPNVCGDCHRMPFLVSTNTPGTGMDAPTWRGAYDRWQILPQARLNIIDLDFYRVIADIGVPERNMWRFSWASRTRFDPVWDMVLEGGTGFSGAFARQVTLNASTANAASTMDLLQALELSASEEAVELVGEGVFTEGTAATPVTLRFDRGSYFRQGVDLPLSRAELIASANDGRFVGTFTARLGNKVDVDHPQPAIWTLSALELQSGRQQFPTLTGDTTTLAISGRHIRTGAHIILDGRRVAGNVRCQSGSLPNCASETVVVQLATLPLARGQHFLQLQNPDGLVSNELIINTTVAGSGVPRFDLSGSWFNPAQDGHGWFIEQIPGASPQAPDQLAVYWYVYSDAEPVWLIAQGALVDGRAEMDTFIASGGQFPPAFDPAQVSLLPWGRLNLEFADDETGSILWSSALAGFGEGSLNIQRIAGIGSTQVACQSGSYYSPDQSGHGFVAQVLDMGNASQLVLSWYVYREGKQVWLLGQAPLIDGRAEVPMNSYTGADFPPDFLSSHVQSADWGTVTMRFTGADTARVDWVSEREGYGSGGLDLVRLTRLAGQACN